MSLYDYEVSRQIDSDLPFAAIIMIAMRRADTDNSHKLKIMWPEIWEELQARYWASGGRLSEDNRREADRRQLFDESDP